VVHYSLDLTVGPYVSRLSWKAVKWTCGSRISATGWRAERFGDNPGLRWRRSLRTAIRSRATILWTVRRLDV